MARRFLLLHGWQNHRPQQHWQWWLADQLRVSYGDALLQLCRMVLRAGERYPLRIGGRAAPDWNASAPLHLVWPPWYPAGSEERARDADTVLRLLAAGQLSRAAAARALAADWGADAVADAEILKTAAAARTAAADITKGTAG